MRKLLVLLVSMLALVVHAQDVIVKKGGSTILSKVLEVNQDNVKYKKHSNPNGPTYTISIADIMAINYANGEKDTFDAKTSSSESQSANNSSASKLIEKKPDARNAEIINMYKTDCSPTSKIERSSSAAKDCYSIWEVSSNSVMSNEDLEVTFVKGNDFLLPQNHDDIRLYVGSLNWGTQPILTYNINIFNKTNSTIYIDKANCFRIMEGGKAYCYYDTSEQTTVSHGSGGGASVGLGGIAGALGVGGVVGTLAGGVAVGGGSSNTVSTTYSQQRILAIPPHGRMNLTNFKQMDKKPFKIIEHAEYFQMRLNQNPAKRGIVERGQVLTYDTNNSPWKRQYFITYSTDSNFSTYSTMKIELYIHQLIGDNGYTKMNHVYAPQKYLNGIKNNTLLGWDWLEK